MNPCDNTALFSTNTTIADMEYTVGETTVTQSFTGVSDTVSNNITTSGNCGNMVYTLANNDTRVGTSFIEVVDLLNAKGLAIYSEDEDNIGNYTITVTARMDTYPQLTVSFDLLVIIAAVQEDLPASVSFPPFLNTDVSAPVLLDPGVAWSLTLDATDPDDDLATVDVEFTGSSSDWIEFE